MGFPWKKVGKIGLSVVSAFVPGLEGAIDAIEVAMPGVKGDEKKAAVIAISRATLPIVEQLTDKDLDDPTLEAAQSAVIDAYVASRNAEAAYVAAVDAMKAAIANIKHAPKAPAA